MKKSILLLVTSLFVFTITAQTTIEKEMDLSEMSSHPHLKYLGKSICDPIVLEMLKEKYVYIISDDIVSDKLGIRYHFDKSSRLITRIRFSNESGRNDKKYKGLKKLPLAINNIKIEPTAGGVYYELVRNAEGVEQLHKASYENYLTYEINQRKNNSDNYLVKTREDLNRYFDPKGDDILDILDKQDDLFDEYQGSNRTTEENSRKCYSTNLKAANIHLKRCSPKKKAKYKEYSIISEKFNQIEYNIAFEKFNQTEFKDRFPYEVDLNKGLDYVLAQLAQVTGFKEVVRSTGYSENVYLNKEEATGGYYEQGSSGKAEVAVEKTIVKIETKGVMRYVILKRVLYHKESNIEPKNSFYSISVSNANYGYTGSQKVIKIKTFAEIGEKEIKEKVLVTKKEGEHLEQLKKLDALQKDGIYYPIDGSEALTVGVPIMTFKIRKDKKVEMAGIDVYIVDNPSSIIRYWKSKVLKSINGIPMINMDGEKLKKACQGKIGESIEIINEEGLAYRPKRKYWAYGDLNTMDFDDLFPSRSKGVSEGSFTYKDYTYTGEHITGIKTPRGVGVWKGGKYSYKGFWNHGVPEGLFTVISNENYSVYATGVFKNGVPSGTWQVHDPVIYPNNADLNIKFNSRGVAQNLPAYKGGEVTRIEKSSADKRTVIYFNLRQFEEYGPLKLVYSIAYLTGDCECKNESTAAVLGYSEYYDKKGKKYYTYFPSAICAEYKGGHQTNISESELNAAIDEEIYQLWKLDAENAVADAVSKSNLTGRQSKSFSKVYAPTIQKDCTTERTVKDPIIMDYELWFLWK